jgi:AAA+ superfamily predicted ATPase
MARSDLLITLVKAGATGDHGLFRKTVEAMAAEERTKQHGILADRLVAQLGNGSPPKPTPALIPANGAGDLVFEMQPKRTLEDMVLPPAVDSLCKEVIEEHHRADLLRSFNLEPRNRILLAGPPGNGKTSLAEAIASGLMIPLVVLRYETVIGSFLGETASRLKKVFDYVRSRPCVLFLDEFDTLGKERGDPHDTGEVKRVVSSLLLQVDAIPSYAVIITATNHPELLDRAVWRRFQLRLELPSPTRSQAMKLLGMVEQRLGFEFVRSHRSIAEALKEASYSEIEEFALDVARQKVLRSPDAKVQEIVDQKLSQWRARFKA